MRKVFTALVLCIAAGAAHAATAVQGQIGGLEIVGAGGGAPGNFDFRITLSGSPVICGSQTWAYINSTEANYSALVAAALAAKTAGNTVVLHVDEDSQGYCHVDYMDIE